MPRSLLLAAAFVSTGAKGLTLVTAMVKFVVEVPPPALALTVIGWLVAVS